MPAPETPITCDEFESRLSDYLENALLPAEHAAMDAHVLQCDACVELVRDVQNIVYEAHALPLLSPSHDLWPAIESRLDAPVTSLADHAIKVASRRTSRTFSLRQFAAAAVALVTVSSGTTYLMTRGSPATAPAAVTASAPHADSATQPAASLPQAVATLSAVAPAIPRKSNASTASTDSNSRSRLASYSSIPVDVIYEREIESMRRVVDERMSELDPKTVVEIERNIAIIDKAIADSRAALANDPRSGFLSTQLDRALETKLSTLRKVALL